MQESSGNIIQRTRSYSTGVGATAIQHLYPPVKFRGNDGSLSLVCTQEVATNQEQVETVVKRLGVVTVEVARAEEESYSELLGILRWGVDGAKRVTGKVEEDIVYDKSIPRCHVFGVSSPLVSLRVALAKRRAVKKVHKATKKLNR